ncbi:MAG TPA: macro domain-containing protein [Tepidisphaeraceae bacterium]|nr:macro domain-containing protein [Tepidisphaeraceae bacterium]
MRNEYLWNAIAAAADIANEGIWMAGAGITRWKLTHGDILDKPADVLVCSANVYLNLSGGVGGALLLRYGDAMQRELHRWLAERNRRFISPGMVVATSPCGAPYRAVLHAVAVDAFYQSSPALIRSAVLTAMEMSANLSAKRVALAALATGYGRMSMKQFAEGIAPLIGSPHLPIDDVTICVRTAADAEELANALKCDWPNDGVVTLVKEAK